MLTRALAKYIWQSECRAEIRGARCTRQLNSGTHLSALNRCRRKFQRRPLLVHYPFFHRPGWGGVPGTHTYFGPVSGSWRLCRGVFAA